MAAQGASPVGLREILQLTQQGVDPQNIKFKNVTLQSHKYICIREEGKNNVAIIDTATKNVLRLPVNVDSAIMNPVSKVVALRAGNNLQIYNLEMKTKMKSTQLNSAVLFWKWLNPKTIAIVTQESVFHWSMDGQEEPTLVFNRAAAEGQVQIINYRASADDKWLILGGIAAGAAGITGVLQVFSVDLNASQPTMDAHSACFATVTIDGRDAPSNLFCFTKPTPDGQKLNIIEVGVPKQNAFTSSSPMRMDANDFPVSMIPDNKHGCIFILTKLGFLFLYEIQSGKCIFNQKASQVTMFASVEHDDEGGVVAVDQNGRVVHFYIDEANVVPFICNTLNDLELGVNMAKRYNLGGAEHIFKKQFGLLMQQGQHDKAMQLAASSPQGILRTIDTINALKALPGGQALLQYFQLLLKSGKLNVIESIELARPILLKVTQGNPAGMEHIKEWLKDQKLEPSEDLGDLLKNHNITLALSVYLRAKCPEKVIQCFLSLGAQEPNNDVAMDHFKKILAYAQKAEFQPDYLTLIHTLIRLNPMRAKDFALLLVNGEGNAKLNIEQTVDIFMRANDIKATTNILLEYLRPRGDREEDGHLQTKVLEINLLAAPQVADAIMESQDYHFTHFDKIKIAQLCERAQLYQRALEHYNDLTDIKRVLGNAAMINPEFLLEFFGRMTPENCLECLRDLLKFNLNQNIRLVVEVAKKWNDDLTPARLIDLFEEFKSYNGLYFYLGSLIAVTENKSLVFKYIEAAVKLNQLKEVERVCRDNDHYDPKEVKEFLLQQGLKDPRPLIHVCDRFDYVDELTTYLYQNNMYVFIEAYVQRMNQKAAPKVVGSLLDLNGNEEQIKKLLSSVRPQPDDPGFIGRLVAEVEQRNRLKLLKSWLEERNAEGSQDVHVHNGLAKIYVDIRQSPQQFLTTNRFYDSAVVGKYCEGYDPYLAFIAYKRAWGECDEQLIEVTNKNGFFKDQARYLVERQDLELWSKVLNDTNQYRRQLIDQVVSTALPESRVPDEVSNTVKAFMAANLPNELIELLERIILHGSSDGEFHSNRNLQNLLILTAIKADKQRVMDYIKRLDNYDGPDIAKIANSDQYQLFEEAFFIYKKFDKHAEAIKVLLENINDVARATEFADLSNKPETWSILAQAQLEQNMVKEAIASFLKADDATMYLDVIRAAKMNQNFTELIAFLMMARAKTKDATIDNEIIYSYAKVKRLADLEEFISGSHVAKISDVAEACFTEELYEAARILFNHINNNARLAVCLVKLELYQEAVDAARKANAIATWKSVCFSCVDAEKFRLAAMCGINIIVYMDHLMDLVRYYENRGFFNELIALLEQGINLDRAHQGIYTQLGILYAKYKEEKLIEHIKLFWSRLNIPTLLAACQANQHWTEAVFLYTHYDQFDNAVDTMIQHSAECWSHNQFKEIVGQVANTEIYYRAIDFYVAEQPLLLADLLLDLSPKLDHTRVVNKIKAAGPPPAGHLPLIQKYLQHVQRDNIPAVNEAVNQLFVDEENYKGLQESVDSYNQFDQIALAQRIEHHDLLEFRRISAYLYKLNKRWERSIDISKKDSLWGDAMETTAQSGEQKQAELLLDFFVKQGETACFAACLYTCYDLLRPDVVLELAWRNNLMNFAMPFMIQSFRDFDDRLRGVQAKLAASEQKEKDKEEEQAVAAEQGHFVGGGVPGLGGFIAPLSLGPPPGMYGGGGMGGPPMGMGMPNNGMGMGGFY